MSQIINQIFEIEALNLNVHYRSQFANSVIGSDLQLTIHEQFFDDIRRVLIGSVVTQLSIKPGEGFNLQPPQLVICEHGLSGREKRQLWHQLSEIQ